MQHLRNSWLRGTFRRNSLDTKESGGRVLSLLIRIRLTSNDNAGTRTVRLVPLLSHAFCAERFIEGCVTLRLVADLGEISWFSKPVLSGQITFRAPSPARPVSKHG